MAEDAARLSSGQVRKLYEGGETTLGAEVVKTLRRYTPDTFYTKGATDRLIYDQIQMLVEPGQSRKLQAHETANAARHRAGVFVEAGRAGADAITREWLSSRPVLGRLRHQYARI
jgi:hypothetical protein